MPSASIQLYSLPAQLGRRGSTLLAVFGLHVLIAIGLIAGTMMRPPAPAPTLPPPRVYVEPKPVTPVVVPQDPVAPNWREHLPPTQVPPIDTPQLLPTTPYVPPQPAPAQGVEQPTAGPTVSSVHVLRGDRPFYPAALRRAGTEGSVVVRVRVGASGRPELVEVASTSGFPAFDSSAIEAVRRWIFAPAQTATGPVAAWVTFKVTFKVTFRLTD